MGGTVPALPSLSCLQSLSPEIEEGTGVITFLVNERINGLA